MPTTTPIPDCQITPTTDGVTVSGIGLITGLPITVAIRPSRTSTGITFSNTIGDVIPVRLPHVVHTERGVTLASSPKTPDSKPWTLSIVEHFLSACAMAGFTDLSVQVSHSDDSNQPAPELPLLDGSANNWLEALSHLPQPLPQPAIPLKQSIFYRHNDNICLYAIPAPSFRVTYAVDFNHPDLRNTFVTWDLIKDGVQAIAPAQTFGYVDELPAMQAQGLAKGVRDTNTLGMLNPNDPSFSKHSGYTRPLRFSNEPIHHKILDLIGDLSLSGINPLRLQTHIIAINAGHSSHVELAKQLTSINY